MKILLELELDEGVTEHGARMLTRDLIDNLPYDYDDIKSVDVIEPNEGDKEKQPEQLKLPFDE